jgi:hypothetical protein
MDQEKVKRITFRKYDADWWQVKHGDVMLAGLSRFTNGAWAIVGIDGKQFSNHASLPEAKTAARKLFA